MPQQRGTIQTYTGEEIDYEYLEPRPAGGARFDIEAEDGRKWRIDITRSGQHDLVTSWNSDGDLDDVPLPDWLEDVVAQIGG